MAKNRLYRSSGSARALPLVNLRRTRFGQTTGSPKVYLRCVHGQSEPRSHVWANAKYSSDARMSAVTPAVVIGSSRTLAVVPDVPVPVVVVVVFLPFFFVVGWTFRCELAEAFAEPLALAALLVFVFVFVLFLVVVCTLRCELADALAEELAVAAFVFCLAFVPVEVLLAKAALLSCA